MKEIIERAERLGYKTYFKWFLNEPLIVYHGYIVHLGEEKTKQHDYIELCLIQKWLREEKNIVIIIKYTENNEFYAVVYKNYKEELSYDYESYTGALEEGIKKALEILEK